MAQSNGLIVCPEQLQSNLDNYVHLVFENRYSWFYRWVNKDKVEIYSNFDEAKKSSKFNINK